MEFVHPRGAQKILPVPGILRVYCDPFTNLSFAAGNPVMSESVYNRVEKHLGRLDTIALHYEDSTFLMIQPPMLKIPQGVKLGSFIKQLPKVPPVFMYYESTHFSVFSEEFCNFISDIRLKGVKFVPHNG